MHISFEDHCYYIVPNVVKEILLKKLSKEKKIYSIHFETLESFKEKYFFQVKKEAKLYLLEQGETLESTKEILSYLYAIDVNRVYQQEKLEFIKQRKKELIEKNFLVFHPTFQEYIKTKKVMVMGYPILEPYEKKILEEIGAIFLEEKIPFSLKEVFHYENIEQEVEHLARNIRKLNQDGVSYRHIYLAGITEEYFFLLKEVFKDFDIPFHEPSSSSLLSTLMGQRYLKTKQLEGIKEEYLPLFLKIEEDLLYASSSPYYDLLLEEELKNTSLLIPSYMDAVSLKEEALEIPYLLTDEDYLFVLGFNQNQIPKIEKDEGYLNDSAKKELSYLSVAEKNQCLKKMVVAALSSVSHLTISYKINSLQDVYSKSSLIDAYSLSVKQEEEIEPYYSHTYNRKKTGELLDLYYTYGEKKAQLDSFAPFYEEEYRSYCHDFHPFPISVTPLTLSYSHIDDFAKCPFRYYLKYILHLEAFEDTFAQKLGTIYHEVLSKIYKKDFDFLKVIEKAEEKIEWSTKEEFFLERLKKELDFIIREMKEQEKATSLTFPLLEEKIVIPLEDDVLLKGFIDKILYTNFHGKTYYAVFDYKTGNISIQLDYLSYGLYMQLPIYVYLIEKSKKFENSHLAGFFYQKLLNQKRDLLDKKKDLKLTGVVSSNLEALSLLDVNYEKSNWIQNLSINKNGTWNQHLKLIDEQKKKEMVDLVEKKIKEFIRQMKEGKFFIAPKVEKDRNLSCEYCLFSSICFHDIKDNVYIEKGGQEENGESYERTTISC